MSAYIDIIVLLIIVFVIYNKLKNVLGTRPEIKITKETKISEEDAAKLFDLIVKEAEKQSTPKPVEETSLSETDKMLAKIPNFNKENFMSGAKKAFEIIITAFSKGDTETLEMLVSKTLFKKFQEIIEHRKAEGIVSETDFIGFDEADIQEVKISKSDIAKISVKFISEQVNILKNAKGDIIEGDENFIQKIIDVWTFERALTSTNPNWLLVSTKK